MEDNILLKDIANSLNAMSWDILQMLKSNEKLSYSEIKQKLNVSQNKVSKELARLEGALLVSSKKDEIDARVYNFTLSENGLKVLKIKY